MSMWEQHNLTERLTEILNDFGSDGHHFGRPYLTSYQLAIELQQRFPGATAAVNKSLGGIGTGGHDSLPQYLAHELSRHIKTDPVGYPIEGAFLAGVHARAAEFLSPDGTPVRSSKVGAGRLAAQFRLRS